ncbi:MAG: hflK 2 [Gammaproteobacteria bacterium]|jgi:membrane protease subunit HflK|nr:hflK 2 [Gammaproteobacteria bacterium]
MSWNSSNQNDKDPWGRKNPQGPPDLDQLLKKYKDKLTAVLGGKKGGNTSDNEPNRNGSTKMLISFVLIAVLALWALLGIYIVSPSERAVILRFGKYVNTVGPGPHWIPRFIETKRVVNVESVMQYPYQSEMLTKDENIISAEITVFYRVQDLEHYLFNTVDPNSTLEQATASALRQVVGHSTLDDLLTTGRGKVRVDVRDQLQEILNSYKAGLLVIDVNLQPFKPPQPVAEAFEDVIKAREDEESYVNQAGAYAEKVIADARGRSARILEDAEASKQEIVLQAQAAVEGYLALLPEYRKSPNLMRERLYISTLESVLSKTTKVFLDQKNGGAPMLYLPLDKMMGASGEIPSNTNPITNINTATPQKLQSDPTANTGILSGIANRSNQPTREGR